MTEHGGFSHPGQEFRFIGRMFFVHITGCPEFLPPVRFAGHLSHSLLPAPDGRFIHQRILQPAGQHLPAGTNGCPVQVLEQASGPEDIKIRCEGVLGIGMVGAILEAGIIAFQYFDLGGIYFHHVLCMPERLLSGYIFFECQ